MTRTKDNLYRLDTDECLRRLEAFPTKIGRLAFVDQGYPIVLPINYRLHRGAVVFRTDPGSKMMAAAMGQKVAFEVDDVDVSWKMGWSVLIVGTCAEVTDPTQLEAIHAAGLKAWAGAEAHTYELLSHRISGRQIN